MRTDACAVEELRRQPWSGPVVTSRRALRRHIRRGSRNAGRPERPVPRRLKAPQLVNMVLGGRSPSSDQKAAAEMGFNLVLYITLPCREPCTACNVDAVGPQGEGRSRRACRHVIRGTSEAGGQAGLRSHGNPLRCACGGQERITTYVARSRGAGVTQRAEFGDAQKSTRRYSHFGDSTC